MVYAGVGTNMQCARAVSCTSDSRNLEGLVSNVSIHLIKEKMIKSNPRKPFQNCVARPSLLLGSPTAV